MTPNILTNVPVYAGKMRLADMINTVALGPTVEELDTTNAAGNGWKETTGALRAGEATFSGYWRAYDAEAQRDPDGYLYSVLGGPLTPVSMLQGGVAYLLGAISTKHGWGAPIGQLSKLDLAFKARSPIARGLAIEEYSGAADHNSDGVTLGAVTATQRLFVAVHVFALSGTLDLALESDADSGFASPVSRLVVPQFTGPGCYWGIVDGPITDTVFRAACNLGGATPSTDYAVLAGIV